MIHPALSAVQSATPTVAPASADAPEFRDAHVSTGLRVRYAVQGRTTGAPVILLHGYSDSWQSFSGVIGALAREHRVFAPDLRGHGDSDRPSAGYGMDDLAADVIAFMDELGIDRATIVGHSMGSFVAQQLALRAPARVTRLALIGSATTPLAILGISELAAAVEALGDPVPDAFARDFQLSTIHHPIPPEFLEEAVAASLKLPARVWQAAMAGMQATGPAERLGRLGIPTLLFWGERDAVFARSEQDGLLALLPGAVLKVYPDTGHALHWERPREFVRDLRAFLGE